jgi:hypothetical protein
MFLCQLGLLGLVFYFSQTQALTIPSGLSLSDRKEVIRILGLNASNKALSNPYPLGGYSGFEIGYSLEFVNVADLKQLGCTAGSAGCNNTSDAQSTEWRFSRVTIGKGLYHNIDLFLSFVVPTSGVRFSDYGGMVRWSFYQAEFLPINFSMLIHADSLNFGDRFANQNYGAELIAGVNVDDFALYFGGGLVQSTGTFVGVSSSGQCGTDCTVDTNDPNVNVVTRTISHRLTETHSMVGFSWHYQNIFAAAQVDRYRDAVYSVKAGLRF